MPIYEYKCEECDYRFEVEQKVTDLPVAKCPLCGGGPVVRLISPPGIVFKGPGFYATDYGKKEEAKKPSEPKKEEKKKPKESKSS